MKAAAEEAVDLSYPRYVHKAEKGESHSTLLVRNADEYESAKADGWEHDPVAVWLQKGHEQHAVYSAAALETAVAAGWQVIDAPPPKVKPEVKPKVDAKAKG